MAKQFLTSIDLSKNQLLNAAVQNLAAAPGSPVNGQIYFNTVDFNLYVYDGTSWVDLTAGSIESIVGGLGLTASTSGSTSTIDVNVDNVTLEISSDSIRVKDLGISTAKIADGAVTTVKINAGAVTLGKIQNIGSYRVIGNVTGSAAAPSEVVIVTDLANASTTSLVTSSAIKTYVDGLIGGFGNLEGGWDASTGSFPQAAGGTKKGDYWFVSVAGTVSGVSFNVGDVIVAKLDGASITVASEWIQLEVNRDQATTTVLGLVQLATSTEVNTGTDASKVVTPSTLSARTATETRTGIAEIANQTEVNAGTDDERIVTPLKLKTYIDTLGTGGYVANIGNGSSLTYTVTHNLNTKDIVCELYEVATGDTVFADISRPTVDTVTVSFGIAPTTNQYRLVIKK